jgi:hypothetical protein
LIIGLWLFVIIIPVRVLPVGENTPIVRTDFSSDTAWSEVCTAVRTPQPQHGFLPNVTPINDAAFDGWSTDQVVELATADADRTFVLIADRETFRQQELPILVVDLFDGRRRSFRAVPGLVWSVENNLSNGNLDFEDFLNACDADGIFRGI